MVRKDLQQLLQECLEGYDAGLTPDECLSAYPRVRAELEPLFRQAISLRVAYAASPSREFRHRAREKLMFAAGRDVTHALSAEPDPQFVNTTRQRLLNRAGAGAQEALRDVPPPRLPFWANARRHLLETAASTPPKPVHRMPATVRYALSAAVVVLAMAIAGAGFFLQDSPVNHPAQNASAELQYISNQVDNYEQLRASGQVVSSKELNELATRTKNLVEKSTTDNPNQDVLAKLPDLIDRQRQLAKDDNASNDETLANVQQRLDEADQQVTAAVAASPTAVPTSTQDTTAAIAPTPEPTVEPTAEATATPEATLSVPDVEPVDPSALGPGQVVKQFNPDVQLLGVRWWSVTTNAVRFDIPEAWTVTNIVTDENGISVLNPPAALFVKTDVAGLTLVVSNQSGKVVTVVDGQQYTLRDAGNVAPLGVNELVQIIGVDPQVLNLHNMLNSIEVFGVQPTATPEATSTPGATVTSTATATATATPEATADASVTPSGAIDENNP